MSRISGRWIVLSMAAMALWFPVAPAVAAAPDAAPSASAGTNTALAVSLNKTNWSMHWYWPNAPYHSPPVVVTATGGTGSYTYQWQRISGDPSAYALNPTGASTSFNNYIPVGNSNVHVSYWRCVIVDSGGAVAVTPDVRVSLEVSGGSGGIID